MGKIKDLCDDLKFICEGIIKAKSLPTKNKVLKYLRNKKDDWCTLQEISQTLKINEKKIIKILYKLEENNLIINEAYDIDDAPEFSIFRITDRRLL